MYYIRQVNMTMFFDDEFDRLFKKMSRPFGLENVLGEFENAGSSSGPLYYGYTMTVGPDGKPVIQEYGNVRPRSLSAPNGREPLVDTIVDEKDNVIKLVAEMPGVEKNDIKVVVEGKSVDISAEHGEKKYQVKVPIKDSVDKDSAKATYKNGVLEVSFKRIQPEPTGKTLEVN